MLRLPAVALGWRCAVAAVVAALCAPAALVVVCAPVAAVDAGPCWRSPLLLLALPLSQTRVVAPSHRPPPRRRMRSRPSVNRNKGGEADEVDLWGCIHVRLRMRVVRILHRRSRRGNSGRGDSAVISEARVLSPLPPCDPPRACHPAFPGERQRLSAIRRPAASF